LAFNVTYKSSVKEDLKNIPKKEIKKILNKIEKLLAENPLIYPQLKGEFKGLRKFRVGNYRVIFNVNAEGITVIKIGNIKNVYD
jgi:mRNA interferase RelE/StbE